MRPGNFAGSEFAEVREFARARATSFARSEFAEMHPGSFAGNDFAECARGVLLGASL